MHVGIRSCDHCGNVIDDGRQKVEVGDLVIDREFRKVTYKGVEVHLGRQQFDTLELLVMRAGKLVPRSAFFISILPEDVMNKQLDVLLCRLRHVFKQVDPEFDRISTVWGCGYTWLLPNQERLAA